jgi:hypothetical protein
MPGSPSTQIAYAAGVVAFVVFSIGLVASVWMKEPDPKVLE